MHCYTKFHQNQSNCCWDIAFNIFKMATIRYLGFLKVWFFEQPVSRGGLICVTMQNFIIIGRLLLEISRFFIFKMAAFRHLGLKNFSVLVDHQIGRPNMHHRTKFHQNRSNCCWDIALNNFENGGHPPFEFLKVWFFWTFLRVWRIRHFGFVGQILGRPTTRIWWSLLLCKTWLQSR